MEVIASVEKYRICLDRPAFALAEFRRRASKSVCLEKGQRLEGSQFSKFAVLDGRVLRYLELIRSPDVGSHSHLHPRAPVRSLPAAAHTALL